MKLIRNEICRVCALLALLNGSALAGGGGASITLHPVPPGTNPASSYPSGTTIVGQEITLGSVPARVWFEVYYTGWAPEILKVVQATISGSDLENDGGGYAGANAECMGQPSLGAGDLQPAIQACSTNADCAAVLGGTYPACSESSYCVAYDGVVPPWMPVGNYCWYAFENECHPEGDPDDFFLPPVLLPPSLNPRFGFAADLGVVPQDFSPTYVGTLVLDVPANAKGTYTIDFDEQQTFMKNDGPLGDDDIPVMLFPAKVTIPCGRCCSGYEGQAISCADRMAEADCANAGDQVFSEGELCPASGGPACPACASNVDCNDGVACTSDQCGSSHSCENIPVHSICDDGQFCNGSEVCNMVSGCGPGDPPCSQELCDEAADACLAGIPTVSNWGLVVLILALMVTAKLRYSRPAA